MEVIRLSAHEFMGRFGYLDNEIRTLTEVYALVSICTNCNYGRMSPNGPLPCCQVSSGVCFDNIVISGNVAFGIALE